jgi:putative PIN family toxin of toxin-antitoxin system
VIKVVIDTNVLASGFLTAATPPGQLIDAWLAGLFELIVSAGILRELQRTFTKPYFVARLGPVKIANAQTLLRTQATLTPLTIQVQGVATHPEDDLILSTAVSAQADYLVTGDIQLQKLGTFRGVKIVGPSEFVQILAQVAGPE